MAGSTENDQYGVYMSMSRSMYILTKLYIHYILYMYAILLEAYQWLTISYIEFGYRYVWHFLFPQSNLRSMCSPVIILLFFLCSPESLKRKAGSLFGSQFNDQNFKKLEQCLRKIKEKQELVNILNRILLRTYTTTDKFDMDEKLGICKPRVWNWKISNSLN